MFIFLHLVRKLHIIDPINNVLHDCLHNLGVNVVILFDVVHIFLDIDIEFD